MVRPIFDINLEEEVRNLVAQVPEGKVTTYGHVARALGDVIASRFVGKVMSENEDVDRVPCRRVVKSDGTLGGFTGGGTPAKRKYLRKEGIEIDGDKIIDFESRLFTDFKTSHPLKKFRGVQLKNSKRLSLEDDYSNGSLIAGADIAYDGDLAFGALVVLEKNGRDVKSLYTTRTTTSFPYIPTYLGFREAPVVSKLMEELDEDIVLAYDGNGIMHPLGFGIASHIGVVLNLPTIGVAKKLLCGTIMGNGMRRRVMLGDKQVGYAVRGKSWSSPVYVSPGHRISPTTSLKIMEKYWKYRLPEPVRCAHIEAGKSKHADGHREWEADGNRCHMRQPLENRRG